MLTRDGDQTRIILKISCYQIKSICKQCLVRVMIKLEVHQEWVAMIK